MLELPAAMAMARTISALTWSMAARHLRMPAYRVPMIHIRPYA